MNTVRARIAAALLLVAAAHAGAQQGDVFDSSAAAEPRRPFHRIPERYPDCASAVQRYWDKTDEAQALADQRARAVDPETHALTQAINDVAEQRALISADIKNCVRASVIGERTVLTGSVEQVDLDRGIAKDEPEVHGESIRPQDPGSAQAAATGSTVTTSVSGVILPRNEPNGGTTDPAGDDRKNPADPPGGGGKTPSTPTGGEGSGDSDASVDTELRGEFRGSPQMPRGSNEGGAPNDSMPPYLFAQGMLQGVNDAGQELGGALQQVMIATGYLLADQPQKAKEWLGIEAEESAVWNSFVSDVEDWVEVFTGDPTGTDLMHSFESGRAAGTTLTSLVAAKFGQSFRNVLDVNRPPPVDGLPQMPSRYPGTPPLAPPQLDATQDAEVTRPAR